MIELTGWVAIAFLAGTIARLIMGDRHEGGIVATTLLGIAGVMVADLAATSLRIGPVVNDFSLRSIGFATSGSMVLLFLYGFIARPRFA